MVPDSTCHLCRKAQGRVCDDKGGHGVWAVDSISCGELIAVFGGEVVTSAELAQLTRDQVRITLQIDDDAYLVTTREGPADWINHSCNPNAGFRGQVSLVAMRDILPGEEITFDYAMSDATPYDEFDCQCGAIHCRGRVAAEDWRRPALWRRYHGFFSPYLQRRIDALKVRRRKPTPVLTPLLYTAAP
jgi:hypothetical protein